MFRTILPTVTLCILSLIQSAANAQSLSIPPESRGELLYSVSCGECHASEVHWREKKLATNWSRLIAEVRRWKVNGRLDWSEDDVIEVARYLDVTFYRFPSRAEESSSNEPILTISSTQTSQQPQSHAGIAYVSGGVGLEERKDLQAIAKNYNLKLVFSLKDSGEYIRGIKISITDTKNAKILETDSAGPWFLANLPAGQYKVGAEMDGKRLSRSFAVGKRDSVILHMYWP